MTSVSQLFFMLPATLCIQHAANIHIRVLHIQPTSWYPGGPQPCTNHHKVYNNYCRLHLFVSAVDVFLTSDGYLVVLLDGIGSCVDRLGCSWFGSVFPFRFNIQTIYCNLFYINYS